MEYRKNKFYHVHKLITFLFLFFQIFTGKEILLANAEGISGENIVTNVTMDENFESGDGSNDHNVSVYAEFTLPDTVQPGDSFSIVYDEKLSSIGNDTDIPVKSANGIVIGTMDIDATTRTVTVTLNDNVTKYNNIKGTLSFEREADRSEFTQGSGEYSFNFITGDKTITAKSNIQFTNSGFFNRGLAKYPVSYDPETGLHKWVIIVNPQQANMPVLSLTDEVQSGNMTIESYKVYTATTVYESLGYELGEFLGGANVSAGSFNINLDSGRDSYIIEVYTKGDPNTQDAFKNSAKIEAGGSWVTANAFIYPLNAEADADFDEATYEFHKFDTSKNPLAGAEFTATNDYDLTEVHTATSDAEGKVIFTGLKTNVTYTIKETKAPSGYVTDESFYAELSFDEKGEAVVTTYNTKEGTYLDGNTLYMANSPQEPGMTVEKTATRVTDSADVDYDEVKFKAEGDKIYYSFTFTNTG
ncbi:Ig-like domain-containing protein, partial [Globicatella sanguinis]